MPISTLTTAALGPFTGTTDTKGSSIPAPGLLRNAANLVLSGLTKWSVQPGDVVALSLLDDADTPAAVTKVLAVQHFADGAIAVAHSTVTEKVYLYRMPATMDGWYDATGALHSDANPQPVAVLWSSVTAAPDISLDEGLGTLYVAQTSAIDVNGLYFATQTVTFDTSGVPTQADLMVNGTDGMSAGTDTGYFTLLCAFHQAIWAWGYGAGDTAGYTSYRPELGKFTPPSFGNFQLADSIAFGDEVRALRQRPICAVVAGDAMFVGAAKSLFRVTGYGRDSWTIETVDQKYGIVGPKAAVGVGDLLYAWSSRGPFRVGQTGAIDPLWDAVIGAVGTVANESQIVCGFDPSTDRVVWLYDSGSGVRTLCAFDTRRDAFVSVNGDAGLVMACAGLVEPIYQSTATPPATPGAPTIVSTTLVTISGALCTWSVSDALAEQEVSYRVQGDPGFTTLPLVAAGLTTAMLSGLNASVPYEWRVRSTKNGLFSSYVGPITASQFTTLGGASGISPPSGLTASQTFGGTDTNVSLVWANTDHTLPVQVFRSTDGVSFLEIASLSPGAVSGSDNPGAGGTFYYKLQLVASDGTTSGWSNVATVTIPGPI